MLVRMLVWKFLLARSMTWQMLTKSTSKIFALTFNFEVNRLFWTKHVFTVANLACWGPSHSSGVGRCQSESAQPALSPAHHQRVPATLLPVPLVPSLSVVMFLKQWPIEKKGKKEKKREESWAGVIEYWWAPYTDTANQLMQWERKMQTLMLFAAL